MATKEVEIDGIGTVKLIKRAGVRSIRIVVARSEIRVTMPTFVPFAAGVQFAKAKRDWIQQHHTVPTILEDGRAIGKQHTLKFVNSTGKGITTRVTPTAAMVALPAGLEPTAADAQIAARAVALRALRAEAKKLLPPRLHELADHYGFMHGEISIKHMQSRWGSCNQDKDIALNCFLVELDWALIDYVILHELTHTRIMAHGKPFWDELAKYVPHLALIRKRMKFARPDY